MADQDRLLRQIQREKNARVESEMISEKKTLDLYFANDKLRNLAESLREKEEKTSTILEAIADAVIVTNLNDEIIMYNKASRSLFKYDATELLGKFFYLLIESDENNDKIQAIKKNKKGTYDLIAIRKDKVKIPIELVIAKTQLPPEMSNIIYAIRDISERKIVEKRAQMQYAITIILAESLNLEDAMTKILQIFCENLNLELGALWNLDRADNVMRCVSIWNKEIQNLDEFIEITRTIAFHKGMGLPGRVWKERKPYWVSNVVKDPNFPRAPFAAKANLHNGFGFPVLMKGEVISVIELYSHSEKKLDRNLLKILDGVSRQIGLFIERKHAQERVSDLNRELFYAARRAGMAEVATSVLHNIGNVLNSVNVSASLLKENIMNSDLSGLEDLAKLFNDDKSDLVKIILTHPKGQYIQKYIKLLAINWKKEQENFLKETDLLTNHIHDIKNIVHMQQSLSGAYGVIEPVAIADVIEDAIAIIATSFEKLGIIIERDYAQIPNILIDRVKLLQILINLIRNAKDALNVDHEKKIKISTELNDHTVLIRITDTGTGISAENLKKLFSFGFTTKKDGHGFGLHISGLSAQELGGQLTASSEGYNRGSTFTMSLPIKFSNS